jgi:hypothetical protein
MNKILECLQLRTINRLLAKKRSAGLLLSTLIMLSLLATSGCAVRRVRADFTGFEKAYADTSNHELLLNLARLQNHDPTYFFKIGQITSSYRMSATAPTSVGFASQSSVAGKSNTTGGATPGLSYESDPLFQFIPVNDETNAQLLLKPIPPETFYVLYQQGWRIDQLFRLMVDRIEVTNSTASDCKVSIFRNVPPLVSSNDGTAVHLDPLQKEELSSYAGFLRASAIAYALQKHGNLVLREVGTFVPLDPNAVPAGPSTQPKEDLGGSSNPPPASSTQNPADTGTSKKGVISATDIEKAAEKNLSYESVKSAGNNILIGQRIVSPRFFLIPTLSSTPESESVPNTTLIMGELASDPLLRQLTGKDNKAISALTIFLGAVQNGFAIEDNVEKPEQGGIACPVGKKDTSARLVLRSLIGVMASAAQEQLSLERLLSSSPSPIVPNLEEAPGGLSLYDAIPEIERLPILRINWNVEGGIKLAPPKGKSLTELNYQGTEYLIADLKQTVPENEYWNRDVFRLIAALTAQVTVDTSKYPIANILQLNVQ